jgi:hypothetical protein
MSQRNKAAQRSKDARARRRASRRQGRQRRGPAAGAPAPRVRPVAPVDVAADLRASSSPVEQPLPVVALALSSLVGGARPAPRSARASVPDCPQPRDAHLLAGLRRVSAPGQVQRVDAVDALHRPELRAPAVVRSPGIRGARKASASSSSARASGAPRQWWMPAPKVISRAPLRSAVMSKPGRRRRRGCRDALIISSVPRGQVARRGR